MKSPIASPEMALLEQLHSSIEVAFNLLIELS